MQHSQLLELSRPSLHTISLASEFCPSACLSHIHVGRQTCQALKKCTLSQLIYIAMSCVLLRLTVRSSVPLTDQIPIGANAVKIDITHNPKHNSDNENIGIHGLPARKLLSTSSEDTGMHRRYS